MPLDHYVTLGRSGLRVSPLCLGAMTFGDDWGWGSSVEDSQRIIDRYLERGGNFIDTANAYTKGHSERIIGDHLGRHPHKRDRVVLATKFVGNMVPGDPNAGGAGRKALTQQCEESLRRLQTDVIDLYWMHAWDAFTPIEETLRALDDLVAQGKVRYVGVSDAPAWKVAQANTLATLRGWTAFVGLQVEYSLLERTIEGELVPMARELGLGITPWAPLKSGILSGKYTRENVAEQAQGSRSWVANLLDERAWQVIDRLRQGADELHTTPARIAVQWIQQRPGVASTIIGARTVAQLDDNVAALDLELPAALVADLEQLTRPQRPFPCDFLEFSAGFRTGGATINGVEHGEFDLAPELGHHRYLPE